MFEPNNLVSILLFPHKAAAQSNNNSFNKLIIYTPRGAGDEDEEVTLCELLKYTELDYTNYY